MPTFEYQAVNSSGERVSGTVAGGSIEQALTSLTNNGYTVERINQSAVETPPMVDEGHPRSPYAQPERPYQQEPPRTQPPPTEQRSYVATSVVGPLAGGGPCQPHDVLSPVRDHA